MGKGGLDSASLALERTRLIDAEGVTHLSFRVERPGYEKRTIPYIAHGSVNDITADGRL